MLDLHRLHLLHHFAVQGSIAGTAAALGYSPSAVSQQLAALEREAGTALLDRTARSATLTDQGHRLARHAGTILDAVEAAQSELAATSDRPSGRIEICAVPTAAVRFAPVLARLQLAHPAMELVVHQAGPSEAMARLRSRDADLAVIDAWTDAAPPAGLWSARLLADPLVVAVPASHPLADPDAALDLRSTEHEPWICAPRGEASRDAFEQVMGNSGVRPTNLWEFEGLATIVALVGHGVGLALVPSLAVPRPVPSGLVVRHLADAPTRFIDALVRTTSQERPAIAVTLQALQDAPAPPPLLP
jgi:DNA-binding transcriptional LysR family regulator